MKIPYVFLMIFGFVLMSYRAMATHVRAGDLVAERISTTALTYKFTVTIYTDDDGVEPDSEILFDFGTGEQDQAFFPRIFFEPVGNRTTRNIYEAVFTFPGAGEYEVGIIIRNRNPGINNIPGSVNVPFYIESTFLISPFLGLNRSPVLLVPPIDQAARGRIFIHNPGAFDADGDSLAYVFANPKRSKGNDVDGFSDPDDPIFGGTNLNGGPATITLDSITGDLVWDTPGLIGEYNVAFIVQEWRDGVLIGQVNRDMQIIVRDNPNNPPQLNSKDTCFTAGTDYRATVRAVDPDGDFVRLSTFSGLYADPGGLTVPPSNYATFTLRNIQPPNGQEEAIFRWQTVCEDVQRAPYTATFKAEDTPVPERDRLADLQTWRLRVVGPAPDTLIAEVDSLNASVRLSWLSYICPNADRMTIWRRRGSFDFEPGPCQTGLPDFTGYEQIGEVPIDSLGFLDENLERGRTYCYRIFARFPEPRGGESYTSIEVCVAIPGLAPYLTNVSVETTSPNTGEIFVRWVRPTGIDSTIFPRPYTYRLIRAEGFEEDRNRTLLPQIFEENDTTFTDTGRDTENTVYNYRMQVYSQENLIDSSARASRVRLFADGQPNAIGLIWQAITPWSNVTAPYRFHRIYRSGPDNRNNFTLIDSTDVLRNGLAYLDTDTTLLPKRTYCYYVETVGRYEGIPELPEPLLNKSQISCAVLLDVEPPCPPLDLSLDLSDLSCDNIDPADPSVCADSIFVNRLRWAVEDDPESDCDDDIAAFNVYFSPKIDQELTLLATVPVAAPQFDHEQAYSIAGCYAITAIDAQGNESPLSNQVCNDNCPNYQLPNVITPNGDGKNDVFRPIDCPLFADQVIFRVFNRWDKLIYEQTGDVFINWPGTDQNGNDLPSGMYYYEAQINFIRLGGDEKETIKGWIHLLRE
ncbi:MAG: gliding motility-associated C-terminal domain-containing protein [Bernardetiaceae bacterium]